MRRRSIIAMKYMKGESHEAQAIQENHPDEDQALLKGKGLCPKCGKAKAYFFHVKYCKG